MEYRGQKIPENDVFYWEVVLMIQGHEEFTAEIDDEQISTQLYNYIFSNAEEISADYSKTNTELRDYTFYFVDNNETKKYIVTVDADIEYEYPQTDDLAERIIHTRIRVKRIKISSRVI
ncbi:MAG: hypothetical protein RXR43_15585 [Sulfolobus sp.]